MPTFEEYVEGNSVYVSSTLGRLEYHGTVPPDPTILPDAAILLHADRTSTPPRSPVDAPWTHPRAAEWDAMTLGEWIRAQRGQRRGHRQPDRVLDPARLRRRPGPALVALRPLVRRLLRQRAANVGTFERNSDTANGAQERRFVGGSQLIPLRLARQLGDLVALAAPVTRIDQGDGHAVVHTGRGAGAAPGG